MSSPTTIPMPIDSSWILNGGTAIVQAPNGETVISAGSNSSFSRDLGTTPAKLQEYKPGYTVDGTYALTFSISNYFQHYPAYYEVELSFGTQELGSFDGWGVDAFTQIAHTFLGPGYIVIDQALPGGGPVQGTQNLVLAITVPIWQAYFNNFSLTFTPSN